MSKGGGIGRKRNALKLNKGMDKCDASSHSKQCGRGKEVSKGNKKWMSLGEEINPHKAEIFIQEKDDE